MIFPKGLREEGPTGGHFGNDKTLHKLREQFYWPGNQKDVATWCRTCKDCPAWKGPAPKQRAALTPIEVGSPLVETEEGNRYILVVGDHFTK